MPNTPLTGEPEELLRLREALQESEERYRTLLGGIQDGVFMVSEGKIRFTNHALALIVGHTPEELKDRDYLDLVAPGDRRRVARYHADRLAGQDAPQEYEFQILHRDGQRRISVIGNMGLVRLGGRQGVIGTLKDITERLEREREREHLIQQLEARNAELERFAYSVSHDLKSPLITINGFLLILKEDLAEQNYPALTRSISRIARAADGMDRLLDELLEMSRTGRLVGPTEEIQLVKLVQETLERVAGRVQPNRFRIELDRSLPTVRGDRTRIMEVFQNLLENAAKFIGEQRDPCIQIGRRELAGETVLFVRDNGAGIDPPHHQMVFDLFHQLTPGSDGSGVGLALCKRIIEAHGGRIWVESEGAGQGSTFCFTLAAPRSPPAA